MQRGFERFPKRKENYDKYLIENKNFPFDIKLSMIETFQKIEEDFFKLKCKEDSFEDSDKSGSCALVTLIYDNKIYIANIGDSRAIMSVNGGTKVKQLTIDHKPDNIKEFERAIKTGSKIYLDDNDDPFRDESTLEFIKDKIIIAINFKNEYIRNINNSSWNTTEFFFFCFDITNSSHNG